MKSTRFSWNQLVLLLAVVGFALSSCKGDEDATADSDINVATNFIQSALKGDFKTAGQYMLQDTLNVEWLNQVERSNQKMTQDQKDKYKAASVRIFDNRHVNDSVTVVTFSNSYMNIKDSLKVVKASGEWKVDFKYFFNHKTDSLP